MHLTLDGTAECLLTDLNSLLTGLKSDRSLEVSLAESARSEVERGREVVREVLDEGEPVYGVNTGFGDLATTRIERKQLDKLQTNLLRSHHAGVGDPLDEPAVRLAGLLKLNNLLTGRSGVRWELCEKVHELVVEPDWYPAVPSKGSVGASGDLAPLAALFLPLIGEGQVVSPSGLRETRAYVGLHKWEPIELAPKEGLALINGTQVSLALALLALVRAVRIFNGAVLTGALAVEAYKGSIRPFTEELSELRNQPAQTEVARKLHGLIEGSEILQSHEGCGRVQDPYCLRCMPQVLGGVLTDLRHARELLLKEVGGVTDNPLVLPEQGEVVPGGNFHGEFVGRAADQIANAATQIGNLCERQLALLIDSKRTQLPPFLTENSGVNSGMMLSQTVAADLCVRNREMSSPSTVQSIPTGADQEDQVPNSCLAARDAREVCQNSADILGYTALAAVLGIRHHRPLTSTDELEMVLEEMDEAIPPVEQSDRQLSGLQEECFEAVTSRAGELAPIISLTGD